MTRGERVGSGWSGWARLGQVGRVRVGLVWLDWSPRVAALAITIAGQAPQPAAPKKVTVIKAARLIDGQGGAPLANPVVVVEDDRITRVGAGPAGAGRR